MSHCATDERAAAPARIEPATPDDAALVCALIRELAGFEGLEAECRLTVAAVREHLLGPRRCAEVLVAWVGDEPCGLAVYYATFSTFAARPGVFLDDLYVRPLFRRRGIGRALMRAVARIAVARGAGRFEWTTLTWNERARRLYAAIGAREMREWLLLRMEAGALTALASPHQEEP